MKNITAILIIVVISHLITISMFGWILFDVHNLPPQNNILVLKDGEEINRNILEIKNLFYNADPASDKDIKHLNKSIGGDFNSKRIKNE